MFGFFYPETGERYSESLEFETPDDAIEYFENFRSTWDKLDIRANPSDLATFMSPTTGHIVVVREIK